MQLLLTSPIEVTNNGPDTAEQVLVTDALPEGTSFVESSDQRFDEDSGEILLGDLASGESISFDVNVTVDVADVALVNVATVFSPTYDNNPVNNEDDASVDAVAADLELVKEIIPDTAAPGDIVEWTISVTNNGPDAATGIEVEDILPEGVSYLGHVAAESSEFNDQNGLWEIGDLAVDETVSLTISAEVIDTGELVNVAQITASDQIDPDSVVNNDDGDQSEDDEDSAVLTVPEIIDLELTQQVLADGNVPITSANVGDTVTYVITVENVSTVPATGVSVSTQLADLFDLSQSSTNQDQEFDLESGEWVIGNLGAGEAITLAVDVEVGTAGSIENIAQVATANQEDIDSIPGNDAPDEDDQDVILLEVIDPNPVPVATGETFSVTTQVEPINAVIMVDHSGSMGTATDTHPDFSNPNGGNDLFDANDQLISRLQLIRDAVIDFSEREQIAAVKVLGFDGRAGGSGNVSEWFEVTGESPDIGGIDDFLNALDASGSTNYEEATSAAQTFFDQTFPLADDPVPTLASGTNYYFLTDGNPSVGGRGETDDEQEEFTLTDDQELQWQTFVDTNYNEAYGIGFGSGLDQTYALEQVAHSPGEPDVFGIEDDANAILVSEADEIPALLYSLISDSITGTVIDANDDFGGDGPGVAAGAVTTINIDGVVYGYDGMSVAIVPNPTDSTAVAGVAPATTVLRADSLNTPTAEGGRLDFNFADGSFTYFAPFVEGDSKTENFEYTITDGNGDFDLAILSIDVLPGELTTAAEEAEISAILASSLLSEDDEVFANTSLGEVKLPNQGSDEWASDGSYYQDDMIDLYSLIV